ncbi:MAG TPA: diguanylate cyclase [Pseudolabrys sp.]
MSDRAVTQSSTARSRTISIGLAGAALSMASFEVLLKRADEALYEAKHSGRNKVCGRREF